MNAVFPIIKQMVSSSITPEMTDEEKYYALASHLCKNYSLHKQEFPTDAVTLCQSSSASSLINGSYHIGFCAAYAETYMLLCNMAGLSCYCVTGDTQLQKGHIWNIVELDGQYYHVDTAWMDKDDSKIDETYFLKSDNYFRAQFHTNWKTTFACDDTTKD